MSDTTPRTVGGPPPRGTGPSTLIKALRTHAPAAGEAPSAAPVDSDVPARTVAAPPPRAPRQQQPSVSTPAPPLAAPANPYMAPSAVESDRVESTAAPVVPTGATVEAKQAAAESKVPPKITFKTTDVRRNRLRATFRATKDFEDEEYVTEFLEKALDAECTRREQLYNNGQPFTGGEKALPRGRAFQ